MEGFLFRILVVLSALFIAFLLLRELMTWYWKQNEIVDLLKQQNRLLKLLVDNTDPGEEESEETTAAEIDAEEVESATEGVTVAVEEACEIQHDKSKQKKKSFFDKVKEAEMELKNKK